MTPGRLYLVRHGRTAGNGSATSAGATSRSTRSAARRPRARRGPRGRADRRRVREPAAPRASTRRARSPRRTPRRCDLRDGLKEIDYGAYQDVLKAERKLRLRRNHRVERMPGGESLRDVFDRVGGRPRGGRGGAARRAPRRRRRALLEPADARRGASVEEALAFDEVLDARRLLARRNRVCAHHPFRRAGRYPA